MLVSLLFLVTFFSCCSKKGMRDNISHIEKVEADSSVATKENTEVVESKENPKFINPKDINPKSANNITPKKADVKSKASTTKPKAKSPNVKKQANDYSFGKLVYDIPDTMILGKNYTILLRINRDTSDILISNGLGYKVKATNVRTSDEMEVEIVDPTSNSFLIVKNNSDVQLVDTTEYTEWVYNVMPNKSGKLKLNIIVSIIREKGKKQIVYFDNVYVKSNPVVIAKTFWEKYWQWCFSTLIIPFIIWIWNRKKKRS